MKNYSRWMLGLVAAVMALATFSAFAQAPQRSQRQAQHAIQDRNADGICDVCGQAVGSGRLDAQGRAASKGKHFGPADGNGNQGAGPKDGTGYGSLSGKRSGPQNGSGPINGRSGQAGPGSFGGRGGRGGRK